MTSNPLAVFFATPAAALATAAGAAAVLKGARPGLTGQQYRSLLVNNATGVAGTVSQAGAGVMNLAAAVSGTIAAW